MNYYSMDFSAVILPATILFFLGLSAGSFINVLADRLFQGLPVIWGRSRCDYCRHPLSPTDLIPLLSFFLLGGKCRYCRKRLSWQYPIVEFSVGLIFLVISLLAFMGIVSTEFYPLTLMLFVITMLVVIFITDLKYRIIPDEILVVLAVTFISFLAVFRGSLFFPHLLSGLLMAFFFLFLVIISRGKGMGLGDVKYAFIMGLILGFPKIIVAFYAAFLTGAVVSSILILLGKKNVKSTLPFGPFLVVAALIALWAGVFLIDQFIGMTGL